MNIRYTQRGFALAEFTDRYNAACSIQNSSLASEPCIWLGVHEVAGEPARMHLTQEMVAALLPLLQRFVETGSIAEVDDETR